MLDIAEVFRHGQTGQRNTHTHAGRFVHLPEYERRFGDDAAFKHFHPKVIALTAAFANAGEDGVSAMLGSNVADQLLNQHRFANACAAEQTDFAAFRVWFEQVNDLDAGFQDADNGALVGKGRCLTVDAPALCVIRDGLTAIDGIAKNVEHAPKRHVTDWHADATTSVFHGHAACKTFARCEHDAADSLRVDVLCYFHGTDFFIYLHTQGIANLRKLSLLKFAVNNRTGYLHDFSSIQHVGTFFLF